jgi:ribonuclease BN (tRNA processing enzyme)
MRPAGAAATLARVTNVFLSMKECPEKVPRRKEADLRGSFSGKFLSMADKFHYSRREHRQRCLQLMARVIVTTLGTGDAFGPSGRAPSGIHLQTPGCRLLIDPGPATLPQMRKARLRPADVDGVLITHLHGDHVAGFPFLLLDYQFASQRKRPLVVVGPRGSARRLATLTTSCYRELSPDRLRFPVVYREVNAGDAFTLSGARVSALGTAHTPVERSLGYRIRLGGKTIAVTGDTGWCESLVTLSEGADLLLIECTAYSTDLSGHLNYLQIAARRHELKARRILLTHVGQELLRHTRQVRLPIARDGGRVVL